MAKRMNLTGEKFGRLTVLEFDSMKNTNSYWLCACECGSQAIVAGHSLKRGHSKSCGCLQREKTSKANIKHGHTSKHSTTPEYRSWRSMITRCEDENANNFERYGGRGIKICDRWRSSFEAFFEDMGERPTLSHSLDRIDVNGNYEPSNCRWVDNTHQAINKRLHKNNRTGVKGVYQQKGCKKYKAQIAYNKKQVHLGTFNTIAEAAEARRKAEIKYCGEA